MDSTRTTTFVRGMRNASNILDPLRRMFRPLKWKPAPESPWPDWASACTRRPSCLSLKGLGSKKHSCMRSGSPSGPYACAFPLTPHFPESLSQELRREEATRDAPVFRQGVAHKKKVHEELKVIWAHSEPAGRCDFSCRTSSRSILPINWPRCVT